MQLHIITSILFYFLNLASAKPQIIGEGHTCEMELEFSKKKLKLTVPTYINVHTYEMNVLLSLCGKLPLIFPNDDGSCKSVCLYRNSTQSLILPKQNHQPTHFKVQYFSDDEIILHLVNELQCTDHKNFSIQVKMVPMNLKDTRLIVETPCKLEIEMMMPGYQPKCTYSMIGRGLIDLRPFRGTMISVPFEGTEFKLALCGPHEDCGIENAACQVQGNTTTVIGTVSTQEVSFDESSKELKVVSSVSRERKKQTRVEVIIKCNWDVPNVASAKYIHKGKQGRRYRFELESSFGCVKISSSCMMRDEANHLTYDFRSLSNIRGERVVGGPKNLILSLCGTLTKQGPDGNNCTKEFSQVCEINGNKYTNRGSLPELEFTNKNSIMAKFTYGEKCENITHTTIVDLICSSVHKSLTFSSEGNCVTNLLWETPKACPQYEITTESCVLYTKLGDINLDSLYTEVDRTYSFSSNKTLVYNICGKIHSNCSSTSPVSACFIDNGKENILGENSPTLSLTNGTLKMTYYGAKCGSFKSKFFRMVINFLCSFSDEPRNPTFERTDDCTFEGTVYSSAACSSKSVRTCSVQNGYFLYDLTPLIAKEDNYEVKDPSNENITYYLNVCGPLINKPGLLLYSDSMVYSLDSSNPHVFDRLSLLGTVASPTMEDGKLQIKTSSGNLCHSGFTSRAIISFECSKTEEQPKFIRRYDCSHEFLWRTKHACGKVKVGSSCSITSGEDEVSVPVDEISIISDQNNSSYKFNLCSENYHNCDKDGSCVEQHLSARKIWKENGQFYVEMTFNESLECNSSNLIRKAIISVVCDPKKGMEYMEVGRINNCQISLQVRSNLSCKAGDNHESKETQGGVLPDLLHALLGKQNVPVEHMSTMNNTDKVNPTDSNASNNSKETSNEMKPEENTNLKSSYSKKVDAVENREQSYKKDNYNKHVKEREENDVIKNDHRTKHVSRYDVESINSPESTRIDFNFTLEHNKIKETVDTNGLSQCEEFEFNGNKFNLNNIRSTVLHLGNNVFDINFDGNSKNCKEYICMDGHTIQPFTKCTHKVIDDDRILQIAFLTLGSCRGNQIPTAMNSRNVSLVLKCNTTGIYWTATDSGCQLDLTYSSQEICSLFPNTKTSLSAIAGWTAGTLLIVVSVLIISFFSYQKSYCSRRSYSQVGGIERINHSKLL